MALSTGQILAGRYRIVKKLGEGGFGAVYRAWDMNLSKACALKENLATTPVQAQQFQREAQILSVLSHPNLARVTDYFDLPNQGQYLVMDFIDGDDLEAQLTRAQQQTPGSRGLPESQALPWIMQICDALIYLHAQNPPVIHRDIKPANIRIDPSGGPKNQGLAVLVDFGIAKLYDPSRKTTQGARAVTSGYSPPEQYGMGSTDPRSDIYALAATAYHLLSGAVPPDGLDVYTRQAQPPPPAHVINPAVSPGVSNAIQQGMQGDPNLRFSNVSTFKITLANALAGKPLVNAAGAGVMAGGWATTVPAGSNAPAPGAGAAVGPTVQKGGRTGLWIGVAAVLVIMVIGMCGFLIYRFFPLFSPDISRDEPTQVMPIDTAVDPLLTEIPLYPSDTPSVLVLDTVIPPPTISVATRQIFTPVSILTDTPPSFPPEIAPLSGSGEVRLTFGDGNYYRAVLSPDQRHMVTFAEVGGGLFSLYEIDPNNGGVVRTIRQDGAEYNHPFFSADGQRLLVASTLGGPFKIYELDFNTGQVLRQLTDGPGADMAPTWFPGEGSFAYQSDRDGDQEIYIAHTDGGNPIQLTNNDKYDGSPMVSPDGRYIVYYSNRTGGGDIYLYDMQLQEERRLTSNSGREAEPYFSPDGQWIVFERKTDSDYHIWAVSVDGSEERQVTGEPGSQQMPSFSPDGLWVIYHVKNNQGYDIYRRPW